MKKVYRIYRKYETDVIKGITELYECLNNHYISTCSHYTYVYELYDGLELEVNNIIIPEFKTEDEAVEFMIKYKIIGFVALTIEK